MRVIVCIKQVPDPDSSFVCDIRAQRILDENGLYVVNPCDERAVEAAIRLKESRGAKVTAISLGPVRARTALQFCLGMGADEAIHLSDDSFVDSDSYATSKALARAIELIPYDLVLCGERSIDDEQALVGPMLAEHLHVPHVMGVSSVEMESENSIRVRRRVGRGQRAIIECPIPAVLSVDMTLNTPRYVSVSRLKSVAKKEIREWNRDVLGLNPDEVGKKGSPTAVKEWMLPRPSICKGLLPEDNLPVSKRVEFVMSGGIVTRAGQVIQGSAEEAAQALVNFLAAEGFVRPAVDATVPEDPGGDR